MSKTINNEIGAYVGALVTTPSGFSGIVDEIFHDHGFMAVKTPFGIELCSIKNKSQVGARTVKVLMNNN